MQVSRTTLGRAVQSLDLPLKKESVRTGKKQSKAFMVLAACSANDAIEAKVFR